MMFLVILGQMAVLFAMIAIGTFMGVKGWINDEGEALLSRLVVNIFNPILIASSVLMADSVSSESVIKTSIIVTIAFYVLATLVGFILRFVLKAKLQHRNLFLVMSMFGNIGFMGIPVVKSVFGPEGVIYVVFIMLGFNALLYTIGIKICEWAGNDKLVAEGLLPDDASGVCDDNAVGSKGGALRRMLNPGVVACVIAMVIFIGGFSVPAPVESFCDYMGNATIPLSMICIGVSLAKADIKTYFKDWRTYAFIAIRMLALPIAFLFALKGLGVESMMAGVFAIELGMPVGSIVGLIATEKGADYPYVMKVTVITTLASIITLPIIGVFI